MEIITLQFQTPQDLATFRKLLGTDIIQSADIANLTLSCNCSKLEIAKAMNIFKAEIKSNAAPQ